MKTILIALLAEGMAFFCPNRSLSQSYYQATVYFKSGVQRNITPTDTSVTVTSSNVASVLSYYGIAANYVYPAFPLFNEADTIMISDNGDTIKQMNKAKIFAITLSDTATRNHLITSLSTLDEVVFAEMNGKSESNTSPNDPIYSSQWGLHNTLPSGLNHDIHAEGAWDIFTGNPNSIIAVVDEGVDVNQADISGKIIGGENTFIFKPMALETIQVMVHKWLA
jgi:hypothetical protein